MLGVRSTGGPWTLTHSTRSRFLMELGHTREGSGDTRGRLRSWSGQLGPLARWRRPFADGVLPSAHGKDPPISAPPAEPLQTARGGFLCLSGFPALSEVRRSASDRPMSRVSVGYTLRGGQGQARERSHRARSRKDTRQPLPRIPMRKWRGLHTYDTDTFLNQIRAIVSLYILFFSHGRGSQPTPEIPET